MEIPDEPCEFVNKALSAFAREAFAKLSLPTSGQMADIVGPGPVKLVRLVRNPTSAHPRAMVTIVWDPEHDSRIVSVAAYDPAGAILSSVQRVFDEAAWEAGEPQMSLPLARRLPVSRATRSGRRLSS